MTYRSNLALAGALVAFCASPAAHAQTLEQHAIAPRVSVTAAPPPNYIPPGGCRTRAPGQPGGDPVSYMQPSRKSMRQQLWEMQGAHARTAAPATGATKTASRATDPRLVAWDGAPGHDPKLSVHPSGIAYEDPNLYDSPC